MNGKTKQMWSAESTGAVIRKCSVNNVFWIIGENSEENTCALISLKKFHVLRHATLLKSDSSKDVFTWILRSVKKNTFLRTDTSESVRYELYILLSECWLEE